MLRKVTSAAVPFITVTLLVGVAFLVRLGLVVDLIK
jgi:hypothetical protein